MSILAGETDRSVKKRARHGDIDAQDELVLRGLASDPELLKLAYKGRRSAMNGASYEPH